MSTRSVIARPSDQGDAWEGRYCHLDGFPTGLGAKLWHLYHGTFRQDIERMTSMLIDMHPAGWSQIVGTDFALIPGFYDAHDMRLLCQSCGAFAWQHYRQYYREYHAAEPAGHAIMVLGHHPTYPEQPQRPMCYCHGERSESGHLIESGSHHYNGAEWVYVLNPGGMVVLKVRYANQQDSDEFVEFVAWDSRHEPDWPAIEARGDAIMQAETTINGLRLRVVA